VICGFGRLGTWFGVERFGLEPDLIVFAKGVTSGYLPLGGVMVNARVSEPFFADDGPIFKHGATYAGHPTVCAAALANIDILEREGLLDNAQALEGPLFEGLQSLVSHPLVSEARGGIGLLGAIDLHDAALVPKVFARARERGVIVRPLASGLAVSPPLTVTQEHIDEITTTVRAALDDVAA
jgi:adenosylmethionine-8-amino-7-oxononanoate aminotransferase